MSETLSAVYVTLNDLEQQRSLDETTDFLVLSLNQTAQSKQISVMSDEVSSLNFTKIFGVKKSTMAVLF